MKDILDFPESEPSVEEASLAEFIGPERKYYLGQWARLQEERRLSFHYTALLLGPFWLLYRQLFRETALYVGLFLGLELLRWSELGFWLYDTVFFVARIVVLHLILGLSANRLYLMHCQRQVEKILSTVEEEGAQKKMLQRRGGVSILPPIIFLLLSLIWLISSYYQGYYGINTDFIF